MNVEIGYCKPCGHQIRAKLLADEIEKYLGFRPSIVEQPKGMQLKVDGKIVWKWGQDDTFSAKKILRTLKKHAGE